MNEHRIKVWKNDSSNIFTFTRVTKPKKQAKTTIGITISPNLLAESRKRNLNISRICEQVLKSILEYIPQDNETKSSISFLN